VLLRLLGGVYRSVCGRMQVNQLVLAYIERIRSSIRYLQHVYTGLPFAQVSVASSTLAGTGAAKHQIPNESSHAYCDHYPAVVCHE
jgi:hypothetical protein